MPSRHVACNSEPPNGPILTKLDDVPKAHITFSAEWWERGRSIFPVLQRSVASATRFLVCRGALGYPSRRFQDLPESMDGPFGRFSPFLPSRISPRLRRSDDGRWP